MADSTPIVEKKEPSTLSQSLNTDMKPFPIKMSTKGGQEYVNQEAQLSQKEATSRGELEKAKAELQTNLLGAEAQSAKQYAEKTRNLQQEAENKELEYPRPEFHPTKENAQSLGGLFSMVATFGLLLGNSGKLASQNALGAMTGMLKGWQDGRKDLYERELKEFDKEYKRINDIRTDIQNHLQKAMQLAAIDKDASLKERQYAVSLTGQSSVLGYQIQNMQDQAALKTLDSGKKIDMEYQKMQQSAAQHAESMKLQRDRLDYEKQKLAQGGGKGQGLNQRFAFNITEAARQAGADLINITQMPKGTVLGTFADMTGLGGNTLTSALRNTFTRKITPDEQRTFQQLVSGFENNMSRALGGGYANSGAKAAVEAYKQQVARAGDSPIAMATFLARSKQELQILNDAFKDHPGANEGEINQLNTMLKELNTRIPFNVSDINKAIGKGREEISSSTQKMILPKAPTLQEFLVEAKKANPNASDQDLTNYYNNKYGGQ
jgi:hypothetical protein